VGESLAGPGPRLHDQVRALNERLLNV